MRNRVIVIAGVFAAVIGFLAWAGRPAPATRAALVATPQGAPPSTVEPGAAGYPTRCAQPGPEGYALVEITGVAVISEALTIRTPCGLRLRSGARLILGGALIDVDQFVILDDQTGVGEPAHVEIRGTSLSAARDDGIFMLALTHPRSTLTIQDSVISFPAGISLTVGDSAHGGGGSFDIVRSKLRAIGPHSNGVSVAASEKSGKGRLVGVTAEVPGDQAAIAFAADCVATNVQGFPPRCSMS